MLLGRAQNQYPTLRRFLERIAFLHVSNTCRLLAFQRSFGINARRRGTLVLRILFRSRNRNIESLESSISDSRENKVSKTDNDWTRSDARLPTETTIKAGCSVSLVLRGEASRKVDAEWYGSRQAIGN